MPNQKHTDKKENSRSLREIISTILEQHDGLSLDNVDERNTLSEALETELSQFPDRQPE